MLRPLIRPIVRPLVRGVTEPGYGSLVPFSAYGPDRPLYIAHRGGAFMYPENTMEGYTAALAAGQRAIEQDVYLLTDGGIAVMHDTTVDRTTTSTGNVADLDTAGWQALDIDANDWHGSNFGNALTPPLLPEVLTAYKGQCIFAIEAKGAGSNAAAVSALQAAGIPAGYALGQSTETDWLDEFVAAGYAALYVAGTSSANIAAAQASGATWVGLHTTATQTVIGEWIAAGFKVAIYTVNRRWERDAFLALGVSGFFSDDPQYLSANAPIATTDSFAAQTWMPGMIAYDSALTAASRGRFFAPDRWGVAATTGGSFVLQGWACPIKGDADCDDFTVDLTVTFVSAASADRFASVFITNNDRSFGDGGTPHSADITGYHLLMRKTGTLDIYKRTAVSTTQIATQAGTGISDGTAVKYRIVVSPTSVTLHRLTEGGAVNYSVSTTDTAYRGGYIHFGRNQANVRFSGVSVA